MKLLALFRGINVAGHNIIKMAELKRLFETLGYNNVSTYIQSGNVVFSSSSKNTEKHKKAIETGVEETFGCKVSIFVYTFQELETAIEALPFTDSNGYDTSKSYISFTDSKTTLDCSPLQSLLAKDDELACVGNVIYFYCPGQYGKTKMSNSGIEKKLKVSATTRNYNTALTLLNMMSQ